MMTEIAQAAQSDDENRLSEAETPRRLTRIGQTDVHLLAEELAAAHARMVQFYRKRNVPDPEAAATLKPGDDAYIQQSRETEPSRLTWYTLDVVRQADGEQAALEKWWEAKEAAREELQTGARAVRAMLHGDADAWDWAQFCALLNELGEDWEPRNGVERTLIQQMAQAYTLQLSWMKPLSMRTNWQMTGTSVEEARWQPPRVTEAAALDTAAQMVDRWNRMFLRLLRQLRDLRRYSPPVIVQNAGQVNVANQQVNVSGTAAPSTD